MKTEGFFVKTKEKGSRRSLFVTPSESGVQHVCFGTVRRKDVERYFVSHGDVGNPASVLRCKREIVERVLGAFGVRYERAASVRHEGERHSLARRNAECRRCVGGKPDYFAIFFHCLCTHTEVERKVHYGEVAESVVVSSARHSVKHEFRRPEVAREIHGGFAVGEILVRVVTEHRNVIGKRRGGIAVAHEIIGAHGHTVERSVATYRLVGFFGLCKARSAVEIDGDFHFSSPSGVSAQSSPSPNIISPHGQSETAATAARSAA